MNLEEKVKVMVDARCPDIAESEKVMLTSFLTAECWSIINEYIHEWSKAQMRERTKSARKYIEKVQGEG